MLTIGSHYCDIYEKLGQLSGYKIPAIWLGMFWLTWLVFIIALV